MNTTYPMPPKIDWEKRGIHFQFRVIHGRGKWSVGRAVNKGEPVHVAGVPWFHNRADAQEAWLDLSREEALSRHERAN